MKKWLVWNNTDPNDSFVVESESNEEAAVDALSELDYSISAEPIEEETESE